MNNIACANETRKIIKEKAYEVGGKTIPFPVGKYDDAEVITPRMGEILLEKNVEIPPDGQMCRISIINSDSYVAAKRFENVLVMNFANAYKPGGGFLMGATAQEEALCRCSTLYASLRSLPASEMYHYNNTHINVMESDYMLITKDVLVFRDEKLNLLEKPFMTSVITTAAPNRYGSAAFASSAKIKETFERRIRIVLKAAMERGYKNLVLGAWGCGAFGNKPSEVSACFKEAIVDDRLGVFFDEICFAIYGSEEGKNITEFRKTFGK